MNMSPAAWGSRGRPGRRRPCLAGCELFRGALGCFWGPPMLLESRVAVRCAAQQDNHFSNQLINIDQVPLQSTILEQQADSADDGSSARYVLNHS